MSYTTDREVAALRRVQEADAKFEAIDERLRQFISGVAPGLSRGSR